ncbi:MAG: hypothetical protein ABR985_12985 [Methanotrichaceae archaeon]
MNAASSSPNTAESSPKRNEGSSGLDPRLCALCGKPMGMSAVLPGLGEICMDCLEARN